MNNLILLHDEQLEHCVGGEGAVIFNPDGGIPESITVFTGNGSILEITPGPGNRRR